MIAATSEDKTIPKADLAAILRAYNQVTERLKQSHELLAREVCRLREELQEKNRELQRRERLSALGEMAAGVAHEIRNPLGGIGLYLSLLEKELIDRPQALAHVVRALAGVRNLEGILGDILAFAAGAEPRCRVVRLGSILAGAVEQAAARASTTRTTIEVARDLADVEVCCDAAQVERAFLNLVLNALDAVGTGGHVWIRAGRMIPGDTHCAVVIEDDGPGFDPETIDRVFDPFFTTRESGTGLGLAIVHRIAEAHGGSVVAGRREGGGGAVTLRLPRSIAKQEVERTWPMCA